MPKKLAVVGSANMDLVIGSPSIPKPGETLIGHSFSLFPGGKGANQAVAAARLKPPPLASEGESNGEDLQIFFVGKVGTDDNGNALIISLNEAGVNTSQTINADDDIPTGIALITVAADGENSIVIEQGANGKLTAQEVTVALEQIKPDVVLVQQEIPDEAIEACAGDHVLILNPAPARNLNPEFLKSVDVITPNETETLDLTGIVPIDDFSRRRAAESLLNQGVKNVIITLGAQGAYFYNGMEEKQIAAPVVSAVDTTAAGDAFSGALALFMTEGDDIKTAMEKAVKVASASVTKPGAQDSMPTREEAQ